MTAGEAFKPSIGLIGHIHQLQMFLLFFSWHFCAAIEKLKRIVKRSYYFISWIEEVNETIIFIEGKHLKKDKI